MKTVVLGPRPAELEQLIERRHAMGVDLFDEMWEGSYHVVPTPSAGHAVLDNVLAVLLHRYARAAGLTGTFLPTMRPTRSSPSMRPTAWTRSSSPIRKPTR